MQIDNIHLLEGEVALGNQASATWESLKPFFDEKKDLLYNAFLSETTANPEVLVNIKMQLNVLLGMENYFQEKITTAKLATISLRSSKNGK
jgi:hypothetical protein